MNMRNMTAYLGNCRGNLSGGVRIQFGKGSVKYFSRFQLERDSKSEVSVSLINFHYVPGF